MEKLKEYLIANFEQVFVLLVLVSVSLIYYFAPYKAAFLNVFFIPVLMAGYFLGVRAAATGALLCSVLAAVYLLLNPAAFRLNTNSDIDLYMQVLLWACFLTLTGITTGKLYENLKRVTIKEQDLSERLDETQQHLIEAQETLDEYTRNSQKAISERVQQLEQDHQRAEVIKRRTEEVLHMSMDPRVAQLILQGKLRNEKRHISVLVTDLAGFTPYTEQKRPEQVIQELNHYFSVMSPFMQSYLAHIEKYTGDGVMLEFGAPLEYRNHALMAVVCGWRMCETMHKSNFPWRMRIGLTSGEAVLGLIGGHRRAYTAMGNCANTASRLEALCPPGSMLIDQETYELTKDHIDATVYLINRPASAEDMNQQVHQLEMGLEAHSEDLDYVNKLAHLYLDMQQPEKAEPLYLRILGMKPDHAEAKMGYAEAMLQLRNASVSVKGRSGRLTLYQVNGLRDPLRSGGAVPDLLVQEQGLYIAQLGISPELLWPGEIINGFFGHGARVAVLACAMADRLAATIHLTSEQKRSLALAALMHDLAHPRNHQSAGDNKEADGHRHFEESARKMAHAGHADRLAIELVSALGHSDRVQNPLLLMLRIANAYDTLTTRQYWRDAWEPSAAIEEMRTDAEHGRLDRQLLRFFDGMLRQAFSGQHGGFVSTLSGVHASAMNAGKNPSKQS